MGCKKNQIKIIRPILKKKFKRNRVLVKASKKQLLGIRKLKKCNLDS